jgi:hypothetical protein
MSEHLSLNTVDLRVGCITQPCRIFRHHIQYRLDIRRRAGDDA